MRSHAGAWERETQLFLVPMFQRWNAFIFRCPRYNVGALERDKMYETVFTLGRCVMKKERANAEFEFLLALGVVVLY